jgi:hypothetical protein
LVKNEKQLLKEPKRILDDAKNVWSKCKRFKKSNRQFDSGEEIVEVIAWIS